jgi:peptide deformylase
MWDELTARGTAHPIRQVGDAVLSRPCADVTAFDDDLRALAADMIVSMETAEGVGLAANQIGVPLRVFVFDCPDAEGERRRGFVCNPVVTEVGERRLDPDDEGCLSVASQYAEVARPSHVRVTGQDLAGEPVSHEATGMLARCFQHEADHLAGMLYLDRLSSRQRRKVMAGHAHTMAEGPPPWVDTDVRTAVTGS